MQKLQPQLKAINDKYKNIKINDPRKAEQNQEVMALYKSQGVNPVGGCLPLVLQLPFFYAFYKVLSISIQLRVRLFPRPRKNTHPPCDSSAGSDSRSPKDSGQCRRGASNP